MRANANRQSPAPRLELNGGPVGVDDLRHPVQTNYGHFTVMRFEDGGVRGLDLHLDRLQAATRELFGSELDRERVRGYLRRVLKDAAGAWSVRINVFALSLDREHMDRSVDVDVLVGLATARESGGRDGRQVHGVAGAVVHPPSAQHRVLHGADEPRVAALEGCAAIGQRHLHRGAVTRLDEQRLDADLASGVVETERSDGHRLRAGARLEPRLGGRPARDELDLLRPQLGPVQECHGSDATECPRPVRGRAPDGPVPDVGPRQWRQWSRSRRHRTPDRCSFVTWIT